MKVLICGVGKITRHLLERLGEDWRVTVVDKSQDKLDDVHTRFPDVERILNGDASSPVILDDIRVAEFDYVLALTNDDRVNLAAVGHAREKGVSYTLALVNDQENLAGFREAGVRTVMGSALVAQNIYHYLQDPRIRVTSLNMGLAEIMEIDVSQHFRMAGKKASSCDSDRWRLAAVYRKDRLIFPDPDMVILPEDRLVIIGSPGIFKPVCDLMECGYPHFPRAYGQTILLALPPGSDHREMIKECMHVVQKTMVMELTVFCSSEDCGIQAELDQWARTVDIRVEMVDEDLTGRIQEATVQHHYGLVIIDPLKPPFFRLLTKPALISLAHSLPCPLLIARHTHPYRRILVPFKGTPKGELALELAVDVAKQLEADVAVAVVEEPDFIKGPENVDWLETVSERVMNIAHIHKMNLELIVRKGNPVKEIMEIAGEFNLMIIGSSTKDKGILSPHVGEILAREAPCSVLIVTS